jgi:hypothetical protein
LRPIYLYGDNFRFWCIYWFMGVGLYGAHVIVICYVNGTDLSVILRGGKTVMRVQLRFWCEWAIFIIQGEGFNGRVCRLLTKGLE